VVIVGAGAAGLAAARVLEEHRINYAVLEATDCFGGRLQEDRSFADFPIDLGAEWIHNNASILNVISGKEGAAESVNLLPYHLTEAATWEGESLTAVPSSNLDAQFDYFPEFKFKDSTWYSFISEHYGKKVAHKIRYNSPVIEIDYSGETVRLRTLSGEVHEADRVIVATSIGILKAGKITFTPKLSERKRAAIESVDFRPGIKLFLKFSEKFYPDAISCEVEKGEKTYYDVAFGKDSRSHVLGFLATGSAAKDFSSSTEEQVVESVLKELDLMFEAKASDAFTGDYRLTNWGSKPYTVGTWVEGFNVKKSTLKELNRPLNHRVYFAGEANDPYQQLGVPAAVLSGLHTVDRLLSDAAITRRR
jgi:monoamine oxidase